MKKWGEGVVLSVCLLINSLKFNYTSLQKTQFASQHAWIKKNKKGLLLG